MSRASGLIFVTKPRGRGITPQKGAVEMTLSLSRVSSLARIIQN